ncbi:MarR family transcriptional regulator [Streptomyces coacervatus]|uniref:MarR family transcriptional regulator n=1 Tax=Streptomyces coacervatus TaxID=647381 RepID=UPI0023DBFB3C|nr:MarR family transcriptional regulator [Streptomyces coacervatus]MDF2272424.1 MarR family transcriptional regulator [Streptomyces coacervatus]
MNVTDLTCFAYAIEAGENPLTAGALAARAHVTTGAVIGILNRLERAGYVTRRPDPADRRQVRVAALSGVEARACEVYEPYYARLSTLKETAMKPLLPSRTSTTMDDLTEEHLHETAWRPPLELVQMCPPICVGVRSRKTRGPGILWGLKCV